MEVLFAVVLCCAAGFPASAVSVSATKRMTYVSPEGDKKMFLQRSERADLDSSATGYIQYGDGSGGQYLRHLYAQPEPAPAPLPAFSFQQVNHGGFAPGPVLSYLNGHGSVDGHKYFQQAAKDSQQGYDGYDAFQKGILKKFDNKEDGGFYDEAVGHKKAQQEAGGHHQHSTAAAKGEKGSKFGDVSSHKKGHKTTGYHNVYHKDEYKKEQIFYDESDHRGFSDKHGEQQSSFDSGKGEFEKGTHVDAAHQEGEAGRKGFFQNWKSDEESEGYRGAKGGNRQFSKQSKGGKEIKDEFEKRFGFDEEGLEP